DAGRRRWAQAGRGIRFRRRRILPPKVAQRRRKSSVRDGCAVARGGVGRCRAHGSSPDRFSFAGERAEARSGGGDAVVTRAGDQSGETSVEPTGAGGRMSSAARAAARRTPCASTSGATVGDTSVKGAPVEAPAAAESAA